MFKEWGFLLGEIWVLLALAALIGLIAGWLIWGGRSKSADTSQELQSALDRANTRAKKAEDDLAACRGQAQANTSAPVDDSASQLRQQLDLCHDARSEDQSRIEALEAELAKQQAAPVVAPAIAPAAAAPDFAPQAPLVGEADLVVPADIGTRPARLDSARDGQPDDLKLIKGIGPKLEKLCHSLGFFHFDQVAAWSEEEVAWVDANLEGFKGRVTRDEWVAQAKTLANS